jgi:chromatin segregation and condensation protein Rec8/ScpA/Scc1 (kleisin family)
MALLELLKLQTIKVKQGDLFEDIDIIRNEEVNGES